MDIDGLVKLSDAETRRAKTQDEMAMTMADIALKLAQVEVVHQQAIRQYLENVAKFLEIQWDQQAHHQLLRMRNIKLREVEKLKAAAAHARKATENVGKLLIGGGGADYIGFGWGGFDYFRLHTPPDASVKIGGIVVSAEAFSASSWAHPTHDVQDELPESRRDMGHLWQWAQHRNYYPRPGKAAWALVAEYVTIISEAAAARAHKLENEIQAAGNAALELEKLDWERLKKSNEASDKPDK